MVGDDIKEGTLRLSKDPEEEAVDDLTIFAGGSLGALRIIQNQNLGLMIRQTDTNMPDAFVSQGKGVVRGSVYLKGPDSDLEVKGALTSTHSAHGSLAVSGSGVSYAVQAGPVKSPVYGSTNSSTFTVSTTGQAILHRLRILDIKAPAKAEIEGLCAWIISTFSLKK